MGLVISAHIAAMFLPSPLAGWLSDLFGGRAVAALGAWLLLAAGGVAALAGSNLPGTVAAVGGSGAGLLLAAGGFGLVGLVAAAPCLLLLAVLAATRHRGLISPPVGTTRYEATAAQPSGTN